MSVSQKPDRIQSLASSTDPKLEHKECGRGDEHGPEYEACGFTDTSKQKDCALAGCGFCFPKESEAPKSETQKTELKK